MIKIRKATEKDTETLAILGRITYAESHRGFINNDEDLFKYCSEAFSITAIKEDLNNPGFRFYIIYVDDLPVGYGKLILGTTHESVPSANNCRIDKIYILEDFIHLKLGQKLMTFLEEQAKSLRLDTIWLVVYIKNLRAIKFYEKNHFKPVGEFIFPVNGKNYKNTVFSKTI